MGLSLPSPYRDTLRMANIDPTKGLEKMTTKQLKEKARNALASAAAEIDAGRWVPARRILSDLTAELVQQGGGAAKVRARKQKRLVDVHLSQSLTNGLNVLATVQAATGTIGIKEIAEKLKMSQSTTHRYVSTLVQLGYVERDPVTRRYSDVNK